MKKYNFKVKIYVVAAIILMVLGVKVGINVLHKNTPNFSYNTIIREIKASIYRYEFEKDEGVKEVLANNASSTIDYNASVPALVYHGIAYNNNPDPKGITIDTFKDQMFSLKRAGYNTISPGDLYLYMRGEKTLPDKPILITFDDGRIDSVEMADPVFNALNYKATMFVIGRYSFLNERQTYYISTRFIKELEANRRWDIEAHSYDGHGSYLTAPGQTDGHFFSHKQWLTKENRLETENEFRTRISTDMKAVKNDLEELMKRPVRSFAFPFGDFGQNNTNFVNARKVNIEEASKLYDLVFYQIDPQVRFTNNYYSPTRASEDFYLIRRLDVNSLWSGNELINAIDSASIKKLPYIDDLSSNKGWLTFWGNVKVGDGQLSIRATPQETGGTVILDGSQLWKDYSVTATVHSPAKSNIYVWARYMDDDNNAACNFADGFIHIVETLNGETSIIKGQIDSEFNFPDGNFSIEARVKGRMIECILNNTHIVQSDFLDAKLNQGGIGFKAWESIPGEADLYITNLNITEI